MFLLLSLNGKHYKEHRAPGNGISIGTPWHGGEMKNKADHVWVRKYGRGSQAMVGSGIWWFTILGKSPGNNPLRT